MTKYRALLVTAMLSLTAAVVAGCTTAMVRNGGVAATSSAGSVTITAAFAPGSSSATAPPATELNSGVTVPECRDKDLITGSMNGGGAAGHNVTFPARQYSVNGERRTFALLRPILDSTAQNKIREIILEAFHEYEERAAIAS